MDNNAPRILAALYAQFVDNREFDRMREIMVPEFTQQGPGFGSDSLDAFIDNLAVLDNYSATFHLVANQIGQWHNEIYTGETWGIASHLYEQDSISRKLDMGIRYQDTIENTGDGFKYTSRDLNVVWTQDLPLQA